MARPRTIYPDEPTLWDLAYLGCSNREIAQAVGCHQSLFSKRPDLASVLNFARADRQAAIARLWRIHPAGDLRSPGREDDLVELVAVADRRSIQRQSERRERQQKSPPRALTIGPPPVKRSVTASTEESTEADGR